MFSRVLANVLCYLHRAEVWPAHGTKVSGLRSFLRKRFVMKLARGFGIEREIKLIFPTKFEPRFGNRIVTILRARMAFGQVGGLRGDLVGNHAVFDIFLVREA